MSRLFGAASNRWGIMNKKDKKYTEEQVLAVADYHRELVEMPRCAALTAGPQPQVPQPRRPHRRLAQGCQSRRWSGILPT
eukprot:12894991-Alexandrium_andersonii.AAC.1